MGFLAYFTNYIDIVAYYLDIPTIALSQSLEIVSVLELVNAMEPSNDLQHDDDLFANPAHNWVSEKTYINTLV